MDKRIVFNLNAHWYNVIKSGEPEPETGKPKRIEYRRICPHWDARLWMSSKTFVAPFAAVMFGNSLQLLDKVYAVFRLGYSRKYPDIVRRITSVDIGPCPYKGWDGNYYRVHFKEEKSHA